MFSLPAPSATPRPPQNRFENHQPARVKTHRARFKKTTLLQDVNLAKQALIHANGDLIFSAKPMLCLLSISGTLPNKWLDFSVFAEHRILNSVGISHKPNPSRR